MTAHKVYERIAIVVPVGPYHERVKRCLRSRQKLKDSNFVTLVVTDQPLKGDTFGAINVVTGSSVMTGPAVKRDAAIAAFPDADFYAFLDDDAYADPDWLCRVRDVIAREPSAGAYGGPGLMPDDQSFSEQLSAAVMESPLGGGGLRYRFTRQKARYCDDFPAYNLIIRATVVRIVGGWASSLYGGEDSFICAKIVNAGFRILYDPDLFVFHYRRPIIPKHSWQIYNIGRSRACFVREGDPYSRNPIYFVPLIGMLGLAALFFASAFSPFVRVATLTLFVAFWFIVIVTNHPTKIDWRVRLLLPVGIVIQQAAYAYGFLLGLLTGRRNEVSGSQPTMTVPSER